MDIRKTRTCQQCKAVVPLDKVRLYPYSQDTTMLLCESCCADLKTRASTEKLSSKASSLPAPEYSTYACTRCLYKFRVDSAKAGIMYTLHCPYCGKSDKLKKARIEPKTPVTKRGR